MEEDVESVDRHCLNGARMYEDDGRVEGGAGGGPRGTSCRWDGKG